MFQNESLEPGNFAVEKTVMHRVMKIAINLVSRFKAELSGSVLGAGAGWLYWYYVGCASGTCPITSHPLNSALYGAVMGALLFSAFKKEKTETLNQKQE